MVCMASRRCPFPTWRLPRLSKRCGWESMLRECGAYLRAWRHMVSEHWAHAATCYLRTWHVSTINQCCRCPQLVVHHVRRRIRSDPGGHEQYMSRTSPPERDEVVASHEATSSTWSTETARWEFDTNATSFRSRASPEHTWPDVVPRSTSAGASPGVLSRGVQLHCTVDLVW
jgi:hypothetical protein